MQYHVYNHKDRKSGMIEQYIERILIDEYADKDFKDGYSLAVSDIPILELENFISILFREDPIGRDLILDRIQELIDQRLPFVESKDKYDAGFVPVLDSVNGEVKWFLRRGAQHV